MQHRSIFQHNTVLLASIIVQLAENTVYSLHSQISKIVIVVQKVHFTFSLVEGFTAACSHNLSIYNRWLDPSLGSKVKPIT